MPAASLGWRTDLMLLRLQGSVVDECADHLVVRMPHHPDHHYRWGNCLLLHAAPAPGTVAAWMDVFRREFPATPRAGIGVDGIAGAAGDDAEARAAGLEPVRRTVLTASALRPPEQPAAAATVRRLESERDWASAVELWLSNNVDYDDEAYRGHAVGKVGLFRDLHERGLGAWFGAFLDGRLVSGLGVFSDGAGVARFQTVDTHPEFRKRGLASTLLYTAGRYALRELGAHTLVIVTDPAAGAIRIYRTLGFADAETQVQLQERPGSKILNEN
ncbi:MAG TPA: GNAT family N-acetyltransferase [Actinophytocola sp.]|uniref:GNAT family N-acetyltransferase n=1 Tax=Actinophytocola sp. TaxID=1872138 RepID=UPI002DF89050|nr:GNAT family N-acetyltransferase [Actinophytocola sp.]